MKLKSMKHILTAIDRCDVILKNGQEQFVGLYYDKVNSDRPIVLLKCDRVFNYYLSKALELMPVPCVEQKLLTQALFENTKEGDYIDDAYMRTVATVYSKLDKFKNSKCKEDFKLCDASTALEYIKMLTQTSNEKLRKNIKDYYDEFEINPRLNDIAKNSIKTMLEINYNSTGIEYALDDSMKTQATVYLRDIENKAKMYEVCITYNEFLRNPIAFKDFIEEAKILKKWNFLSHRKKYNQKYFEN